MKRCCTCGKHKPLSEFNKNKSTEDGLQKQCNSCRAISNKNSRLKSEYGLSLIEFQNKIFEQNGKCAICEKILDNKKLTHVDHCHTTGKLRGILCQQCNHAIGLFKDNPIIVDNAARYLRDYI